MSTLDRDAFKEIGTLKNFGSRANKYEHFLKLIFFINIKY